MSKILVIEDDRVLNETICDILKVNGYEVKNAYNGHEGLNYTAKCDVDLVICDVNMPIMNGLDTIKKFREDKKHTIVPFLFLSARTSENDINDGLKKGADEYMTKPFDHSHLISSVERLIKKRTQIKAYFNQEIQTNVYAELDSYKQKYESKFEEHLQSMNEAKTVQNIILPSREELQNQVPNSVLFYKPKERVSGDFYWAKEVDNKVLIAVGDCTGHGIPAALMTMVCTTILTSAVDHFKLKSPKEILTKTNELLCEYSSTHDSVNSYGMDIALCAIDFENLEIVYSGAKRPLYVISQKQVEETVQKIEHLGPEEGIEVVNSVKGSLVTMGLNNEKRAFEEYSFKVNKGDSVYLTSDGFADQFGGKKGKKFYSKRLRNLFGNIFYREARIQEIILEDCFNDWKKNHEQTDDVTVFGVNF